MLQLTRPVDIATLSGECDDTMHAMREADAGVTYCGRHTRWCPDETYMAQRITCGACRQFMEFDGTLVEAPEWKMPRASLSIAASIVYRAMRSAAAFYDDPITVAYGVGNEMGPDVTHREARKAVDELTAAGWTVHDLDRALDERLSPKCVYDLGLTAWLEACGVTFV